MGEDFKEWILGSTALEIAKYSSCSVMIVKWWNIFIDYI
jgi:nucleotide-binding universal stress UspA family protein